MVIGYCDCARQGVPETSGGRYWRHDCLGTVAALLKRAAIIVGSSFYAACYCAAAQFVCAIRTGSLALSIDDYLGPKSLRAALDE